MKIQCAYCSREFRTNQEERDWCDDCEDQALDISSKGEEE